jgi:hypothetical protein
MKKTPPSKIGETSEGMNVTTDVPKLQAAKLIEEINALRGTSSSQEKEQTQNSIRNWTGLILGFFTLGSAVVGLWVQSCSYLSQRSMESELKINADLIGLVNQLNDGNTTSKQKEDAVILLSFYGEKISTILINELNVDPNETKAADPELLIKALAIIAADKKEKDAKEKIRLLLLAEADKVFAQDITDKKQAMMNFVNALCTLCTCDQVMGKLDTLLRIKVNPHVSDGGLYIDMKEKIEKCSCQEK